jgi:cyclic pyranopterin phosphate synthase
MSGKKLSHLNPRGQATMVDVGGKNATSREAVARGKIFMRAKTLALVARNELPKGNVIEVARVAGILAAKRTGELIPLCHPLGLEFVEVQIESAADHLEIEAIARCSAKTGVEMEALTAVSVAALTLYDMCKAADKDMIIGEIRLVKKTGGASGTFIRSGEKI